MAGLLAALAAAAALRALRRSIATMAEMVADQTSHNLFPFEWAILAMACAGFCRLGGAQFESGPPPAAAALTSLRGELMQSSATPSA